jgi:hypothetical protein
MEDSSDDMQCRPALARAAHAVVRYCGAEGLGAAPRVRSMLADAAGQQSVRCRADLDLLVEAATTGAGVTLLKDPAAKARHVDDVVARTGRSSDDVQWAVSVWTDALDAVRGPARPAAADATSLPAGPTVLPSGGSSPQAPPTAPPPPSSPGPARPKAPPTQLTAGSPPSDGAATRRRIVTAVAVAAAIVLIFVVGAFLWLQRDGDPDGPRTSTTEATRATTGSTTSSTVAEVATVWASNTEPNALHQQLLDQQSTLFTPADTCRPVGDDDVDPLGTFPQGPDEASIECFYEGNRTIVYSLFADDATMEQFFADRLGGRDLSGGQVGEIGSVPPWKIDYRDDPDRGSGSIFGFQRTGTGARSEVGFIRQGTSIYAYSYQLGTDYPAYYEWWADIFGGPAPPR